MEETTQQVQTNENKPLIHQFREGGLLTRKVLMLFGLIIVLGIFSGYVFSGKKVVPTSSNTATNSAQNGSVAKGTVVGSNDTDTFSDTAEGVLREGGINGEGAFHLERPGGESQNVYMTSSIVDLSKFTGKKIKVWGQTQKAQYAGWLMDVGKIEVL
jgi:hypothetical protein